MENSLENNVRHKSSISNLISSKKRKKSKNQVKLSLNKVSTEIIEENPIS